MILLIPISAFLALASVGLLIYAWLPCMQIELMPAAVLCAISIAFLGLLALWSINYSNKTRKPIYFLVAIAVFLASGITAMYKTAIADFYSTIVLVSLSAVPSALARFASLCPS